MKITDYKTMRVNWIEALPYSATEDGWYSEGNTAQLHDYEIEEMLEKHPEVEEVWYWYGHSTYEGTGWMLSRRGDRYDLHSMSHCSCYGPVEDFVFTPHTLEQLIKNCSNDSFEEAKCLFDAVYGNKCTVMSIRKMTGAHR